MNKSKTDRYNEYKIATEQLVGAAWRFARLRNADFVVGVIHGAPVIVPPGVVVEHVIATVRPTSTAENLKAQIAAYLTYEAEVLAAKAHQARQPAIKVVDVTRRSTASAMKLN